jgi:hypothetical protein
MHPRPSVAECRIAQLRVPCRDLAAEYSQDHPHPDLDSHPVCAPVAGHVLAMGVKGGKRVARSQPVPRLGWLSLRVEVARRVLLLGSAGQRPGTLEAFPSIRAVHRASVCLAQMVTAKHLPEVLSRPGVLAPVCLADRAQPASFPQAQPLDSRQQPAMGRQVARPRGLAGEYSWDFRS